MNILSRCLSIFCQEHKKIFICCVLGGALVLPSVSMLVNPGGSISEAENRQLSGFPSIPSNMEEYKTYTSRITDYFRDNFGFRDRLLKYYSRIKVFYFGVSPTPRAIVGKNGWLFYTGSNVIEQTRNLMPFQEAELAEYAQILQSRKDWLSSRQVKYIWMIPPNKHSIYPEYLPDYVTKVGKTSRLDQWMEYFCKHTTVPILDFRKVLIDHKKKFPTHDKEDTHWNSYGGYLAYRHLMDSLYKWMPEIKPITISQKDFYIGPVVKVVDLAKIMGVGNSLTMTTVRNNTYPLSIPKCGDRYEIRAKPLWKGFRKWKPYYYTCDKKKYTVLIFHDSFIKNLVPFLADTFNKTIFVRARPNFLMFKWFVDKYNPDLVIEEMGERGMAGNRLYNSLQEEGIP